MADSLDKPEIPEQRLDGVVTRSLGEPTPPDDARSDVIGIGPYGGGRGVLPNGKNRPHRYIAHDWGGHPFVGTARRSPVRLQLQAYSIVVHAPQTVEAGYNGGGTGGAAALAHREIMTVQGPTIARAAAAYQILWMSHPGKRDESDPTKTKQRPRVWWA